MTDDPQLARIRNAADLAELAVLYGLESHHEAYYRAKREWETRVAKQQEAAPRPAGLPGARVAVDGQQFTVHGITHAGTPEERQHLQDQVAGFLDAGASVYCEQGIRSLYFAEFDDVGEMDDYRWAMDQCASLDVESHLDRLPESALDDLMEDVTSVASTFRDAAFSLIESGSSVYGEEFEQALGDIAAEFVTDHADLGTGESYEAFSLNREASRNPARLIDLQRYYERTFLPQPLEREWLRHHDPELEIVTHARNERMADYTVYHSDSAEQVHLIVGAAHQPGVSYYLEQYQAGRQVPASFELR